MNCSSWRSIRTAVFAALAATSALTSATGCEPEGGPSIEGATAEEAAVLTAEVSCAYLNRCGVPQTTCSTSTAPGDDGDCETVLEPLELDECLAEAEPILSEGFACADLDADLRGLVDDCLEAFENSACAEPGDPGDTEFGMPKVCADALDAILDCTGGGENTAEPSPPEEPPADPSGDPPGK